MQTQIQTSNQRTGFQVQGMRIPAIFLAYGMTLELRAARMRVLVTIRQLRALQPQAHLPHRRQVRLRLLQARPL